MGKEIQKMWKSNMSNLWNFREANGKLPSGESKNAEEKKLGTWYRAQLRDYRIKIRGLNVPEQYSDFVNFLTKYNYGLKRNLPKAEINGKMVLKSYKLILSEGEDVQNITVSSSNDADMAEFLNLLNQSWVECGNKPFEIGLIKYKYTKNYTKMETIDWREMPTYIPTTNYNSPKVKICIPRDDDFKLNLMEKINQRITEKTSSISYPEKIKSKLDEIYESEDIITPRYPIYIVSYKRWDEKSRMTSKYLDSIKVDYKIIIRPEEYENYARVIETDKILILEDEYLQKDQGSVPARNFALHHSRKQGHKRHWILDDNIDGYFRIHKDKRYRIYSGAVFTIVEDYVDRYQNVKMAGHNYVSFVIPSSSPPPLYYNNRIYSSILLSNDIEFEWRGKYNEDTDLSLRILKAGYPTLLFNIISANKMKTLTMKGGNAEIYSDQGVYLKAKSLQEQHPDIVKIGKRFGRVHHIVNYSPFKNLKLEYIKDLNIKDEPNEYGLSLINKDDSQISKDH